MSPKRHPIAVAKERVVEAAGDRLMEALGFTSVHFSQPRNTMQTPGIPDRRYYSPGRRRAVWWEAKTEIGRQRGSQASFQALVESVGEEYVLGTDEALIDWCVAQGWVERVGPVGIRLLPFVSPGE